METWRAAGRENGPNGPFLAIDPDGDSLHPRTVNAMNRMSRPTRLLGQIFFVPRDPLRSALASRTRPGRLAQGFAAHVANGLSRACL
ncbi:hypothetical protein JCM15519_05730 [Fundidesulfovibrio butyratiphilus]